jgi:hypothetical protein
VVSIGEICADGRPVQADFPGKTIRSGSIAADWPGNLAEAERKRD